MVTEVLLLFSPLITLPSLYECISVTDIDIYMVPSEFPYR